MHSHSSKFLSTFSGIVLLLTAISLASCGSGSGGGGGGGSSPGSTRDPAGSQAKVDEGVTALEELISTFDAQNPPPYAIMADISDTFVQATQLDPENPAAAFFGAIGEVVLFPDSDDGKAFLGKLGWGGFRVSEEDFQAFLSAAGVAYDTSIGASTEPFTPPVKDPNTFEVGTGKSLSFAELIEFITVTFPGHLHTAVDLLGTIPPGWSYTVTITPPASAPALKPLAAGESITIEIDYTDAMALRTLLAGLESALTAPGIWNFTGIDAFVVAHTDPETGDLVINDADLIAYFSEGQVLSKNAAGLDRLLTSLTAFLDSFDKTVAALRAETDDQSDDLLSVNGLLSGSGQFDAQADVINYGLDAFRLTAADLKAAMTAVQPIGVYQPVAFIKSSTVCLPAADGTMDFTLHTTQPATGLPALGDVTPVVVPVAVNSVTSPGSTATDGAYYFSIDLPAPANLSIYSSGGTSVVGTVGYYDGKGLVAWDSDDGAAGLSNFGISIATDFFSTSYPNDALGNPQAGLPIPTEASPLTLYVRVQSPDADFSLNVVKDPLGGEAAPIFLKGGGGRLFAGSTYKLGSVTGANLGNLLRVATEAFDLSIRNTLVLDDPATTTTVEKFTSLVFPIATLKTMIQSVVPGVTFGPPLDVSTGNINVMEALGGVNPTGLVTTTATLYNAEGPQFCAYPADLMQARLFVSGHSIGVGF